MCKNVFSEGMCGGLVLHFLLYRNLLGHFLLHYCNKAKISPQNIVSKNLTKKHNFISIPKEGEILIVKYF